MPVKKRYISKNTICKVSFYLPKDVDTQSACVVGEFNQWDEQATPMTPLQSGEWKAQLSLEASKEYRYRYLVNGSEWVSDPEADKYVPNPYGQEDAVVIT